MKIRFRKFEWKSFLITDISFMVMHCSNHAKTHSKRLALFTFAVVDKSFATIAAFHIFYKNCSHFMINLSIESNRSQHIQNSSLFAASSFRIKLSHCNWLCWCKWIEFFSLCRELCCWLLVLVVSELTHSRFKAHSQEWHKTTIIIILSSELGWLAPDSFNQLIKDSFYHFIVLINYFFFCIVSI